MRQQGFSAIFILIGILVLAGFVGGVYYFGTQKIQKSYTPTQVATPSPVSSTQPTPIPTPSSSSSTDKVAGLANPASVNCKQKGGKLEIRTAPSGGQYGVCKFSDSTECDEWAYMNGTCKPGQYKNWEENINKLPDLKISFYSTGFTTSITNQTTSLSWTKNSWTEKDNAKYVFLGITVQNTNNFSSTGKEITLRITGDINKDITIPVLKPGQYSQNIPLFIPLPPQNNILKLSVNEDKSISESDYFDDRVFVSLKEGTTITERLFDKTFDYEKQVAAQLTCNDLKLINRINDFPNCSP